MLTLVVKCIESYKFLVENVALSDIFNDIGAFAVKLTDEEQLRWVRCALFCHE